MALRIFGFRCYWHEDTKDYAERVEPSIQGGHKLAKALADAILRGEPGE